MSKIIWPTVKKAKGYDYRWVRSSKISTRVLDGYEVVTQGKAKEAVTFRELALLRKKK
jgi:hypothetical protein